MEQSLAATVNVATRPRKAVLTGPASVPPEAMRLRNAARLPPLGTGVTFGRVAADCVRILAGQLGQRYSRERASLDRLAIYDQTGRQAAAIDQVRAFIASMEDVLCETRGLVLYGSVGTGKDHLLAAALYHVAAAGIRAAWVSGEEVYARIRDSMDTGEREETVLAPFLRPSVLGISDPITPSGEIGAWDTRILARLLDRRYRAMLPTWLTMNAANEDDAKVKLTSLIWDRLRDDAEIIPCFWGSYRARSHTGATR